MIFDNVHVPNVFKCMLEIWLMNLNYLYNLIQKLPAPIKIILFSVLVYGTLLSSIVTISHILAIGVGDPKYSVIGHILIKSINYHKTTNPSYLTRVIVGRNHTYVPEHPDHDPIFVCFSDADCNGHGYCDMANIVNGTCICDTDYTTNHIEEPCNYHRSSRWFAFVLEICCNLVGLGGGGWFYLSRGESDGYVALGSIELACHPIISTVWCLALASLLFCSVIGTVFSWIPLVMLPICWVAWTIEVSVFSLLTFVNALPDGLSYETASGMDVDGTYGT